MPASEKRRELARAALRAALLSFCDASAAEDILGNVAHAIETGEPVHDTLRQSPTLAKHIAEEDRADASVIAGNAWLRAMGEDDRQLRMTSLQRFALAIAAGVNPYTAARAATSEDH